MGLVQTIVAFLRSFQHFNPILTIFQVLGLFSFFHPTLSATTQDSNINVICTGTTMTVVADKSAFSGIREDHLRLSDPFDTRCDLNKNSNRTHFIAIIPLNACGTEIEEDGENLIFKNEITTFEDSHDVISRKHLMEMKFCCQYSKHGITKLGFIAHRENITVIEKGIGKFTYQFEFYPNNKFQSRIDPKLYPLEYDIGIRMFMQIKVTSSADDIELFVESCKASPFDTMNYQQSYSIIENGCNVDQTVQVHSSGHGKKFQFSMEAFKFIGIHDHVYISCSVLICKKGTPNTRCSQGCIKSLRVARHIQKREISDQSANHFISQGPLRLKRSAENMRMTGNDLNPNLVFVVGSLLAAVGMICAMTMYRAKMAKYKYRSLPASET